MGTDIIDGDRHKSWGQTIKGGDRHKRWDRHLQIIFKTFPNSKMFIIKFLPSGGGWVVPRLKIIPLCGPTCKIARFQAELKFPSWTKCGNITVINQA